MMSFKLVNVDKDFEFLTIYQLMALQQTNHAVSIYKENYSDRYRSTFHKSESPQLVESHLSLCLQAYKCSKIWFRLFKKRQSQR